MSQRETLMKAVLAALNAAERPAEVPAATRVRTARYDDTDAPAINLAPASESVEAIGGRHSPAVRRVLRLRIECWAASDVACDPLLDWAVVALLSGLPALYPCLVTEEGTQWDFADGGLARSTLGIAIQYQTLAANPAAAH